MRCRACAQAISSECALVALHATCIKRVYPPALQCGCKTMRMTDAPHDQLCTEQCMREHMHAQCQAAACVHIANTLTLAVKAKGAGW